jgi:hypothetical protein
VPSDPQQSRRMQRITSDDLRAVAPDGADRPK